MRYYRANAGGAFTLPELLIIAWIVLLLGALFLSELYRRPTKRLSCVDNLKQIGLAFKTWAFDNNDKYPMQVSVTNGGTMELVNDGNVWPHFSVMSNELSTPKTLFCPNETSFRRKVANTFALQPEGPGQLPLTNDCNVTYFIGVEAPDFRPTMLLSGDNHLSINGRPLQHGLHYIWTNSAPAWLKPKHDGLARQYRLCGWQRTGVSHEGPAFHLLRHRRSHQPPGDALKPLPIPCRRRRKESLIFRFCKPERN